MGHQVILKQIETIKVAEVRDIVPTRDECGSVLGRCKREIYTHIDQQGGHNLVTGPSISIFYDPEHQSENIHIGAAVPISQDIPDTERVKIYDLPAYTTVASILHHGDLNLMPHAHIFIFSWINYNGYRICGPSREIYQAFHGLTSSDNIVEIQFPVEKA